MTLKVSDLETRFELPYALNNRLEIPEGDTVAIYKGDVCNLEFDRIFLSGYATLTKYIEIRGVREYKRIVSLIPFKRTTEIIPVVNSNQFCWKVYSSRLDCNPKYFIVDGKIMKYGFNDYKSALKANAANQGIGITEKLIDLVFEPIDQQLLQKYREVFGR